MRKPPLFLLAAIEAAYLIRKADIQPGQRVLIFGAGGSIGTYAVQIARHFGAVVTGLDSTAKLDMLRSIGADHVIDYTRQDFTRNGETYDVIFDVVGKSSFSRSVKRLTPNGRYLLGNSGLLKQVRGRWLSKRSSKKVFAWKSRTTSEYMEDFDFLKELIGAGKLRAVIDRCYPLEQIAKAHRYAETGQKKGHIAISVAAEHVNT